MDTTRMEARDFGEDMRLEFERPQSRAGHPQLTNWMEQTSISGDHKSPVPKTTNGSGVQEGDVSQEESMDEQAPVLPPEGGRLGWSQVLASFLINMNVYGLVNAFGEFQHFYETDYLKQYSSSEISWIGTMQGSLTLFVGALSGPIFDGGYFKITLNIAAVTLVFSWMMLSLSTKYYQIMLSQGLLAGVSVGLMEVPSIALIPDYLTKRLGLALGISVSGASVGGLVYSVVFRSLLTATSFAWATRAIGFISLITLGTAIYLIKPKDAEHKAAPGRFLALSVFREVPFLCVIGTGFFVSCAALIPYFTTPSYAISLGQSVQAAPYLVAVLNVSQFFGRVIPPALSDYYGGANMMVLAQASVGLLGLHWITIRSLGGFIEFLVVVGFMSGAVAALPPVVIPFLNPDKPEQIGTRIGMAYAAAGIGVLVGNPIALATVPRNVVSTGPGGFLGAQIFMGLCSLTGAAFFVLPAQVAGKNWTKTMGGIERSPLKDLWQLIRR